MWSFNNNWKKDFFSTLILSMGSHFLIFWQTKGISSNTCIDAPSTLATQATLSRKVTVTGTATKKPLKKALTYLFPKPWACAIIWKIWRKWEKKVVIKQILSNKNIVAIHQGEIKNKLIILSVRVSQYPPWEKKMNVHMRMKKNRNLYQNFKVYSTEQSSILDIYPLANLTISCDPVLAEVLDKNDSMVTVQLSKKQAFITRENLLMYFWKIKNYQLNWNNQL